MVISCIWCRVDFCKVLSDERLAVVLFLVAFFGGCLDVLRALVKVKNSVGPQALKTTLQLSKRALLSCFNGVEVEA